MLTTSRRRQMFHSTGFTFDWISFLCASKSPHPRVKTACACAYVRYIPSMSVVLLSISERIYQHTRQLRKCTDTFLAASVNWVKQRIQQSLNIFKIVLKIGFKHPTQVFREELNFFYMRGSLPDTANVSQLVERVVEGPLCQEDWVAWTQWQRSTLLHLFTVKHQMIYMGCDGGNRGSSNPGKRAVQAIQRGENPRRILHKGKNNEISCKEHSID